jgi:hypothetical protein
MKSILDPSFRYTSSLHTDVRKTFQRIRREQSATPPGPSSLATELAEVGMWSRYKDGQSAHADDP